MNVVNGLLFMFSTVYIIDVSISGRVWDIAKFALNRLPAHLMDEDAIFLANEMDGTKVVMTEFHSGEGMLTARLG